MHHNELKYEESKLIELLTGDSEYAFQLLYDRHRKRIYQTALRYLKSPILAQEVVQDVFLKLWFSRKSLNANLPLEAWLYTVAKNNIFNRLKKIATEWNAMKVIGMQTEFFTNDTENKLQYAQYESMLNKAVAKLPGQQQKVFTLARKDNLTYLEIAESLGTSPLTVKTHMSRALQSIKTYFADNGILLSAIAILLLV